MKDEGKQELGIRSQESGERKHVAVALLAT
jgi:hypothetical protein